jgi:hypothetical protein
VSLPTYDEAFEHATEQRAFSNGTEWEIWSYNNCFRCANDGMGVGEDEPNCPLICVALMDRTPAEWSQTGDLPGDYVCIYFRDRDDPGGREPEPVPDPPGQLELVPRGEYEGTRMYADTKPAEVRV